MLVGFVWNIVCIVGFWVCFMLYCVSCFCSEMFSMVWVWFLSRFVCCSLFKMFIILFVWCIFFIWYFWVEGVILYKCGIWWDMWLILVILNFILFFCVVVNRCNIVLVELFIVIFSVMVFLNVVLLVMLCGKIEVLFCL